jgi:hypothetical protein
MSAVFSEERLFLEQLLTGICVQKSQDSTSQGSHFARGTHGNDELIGLGR